jgi:hypothetical protein
VVEQRSPKVFKGSARTSHSHGVSSLDSASGDRAKMSNSGDQRISQSLHGYIYPDNQPDNLLPTTLCISLKNMAAPIHFTVSSNNSGSNVILSFDNYQSMDPQPWRHNDLSLFARAVQLAAESEQKSDTFFTDPTKSIWSKLQRGVVIMGRIATSKTEETVGIRTSDWTTTFPPSVWTGV